MPRDPAFSFLRRRTLSLHPAWERFRVTPPRSWTGAVLGVDTDDPPRAWYRQIGARVRRNVLLKGVGTPVAIFVFFLAYRHLLNYPMFPVSEMPLTALDDVIGFYAPALLLYVSLWLYVSIPPALLRSRRELIEYTWAIGGMCLVGLVCFLLWPTSVPPLGFERGRHPGFGILQGLDAAGNACPSLHVAAALFSAIWLDVLFREMRVGWGMRGANWCWGLGIVYSAMATKQHVAIDVLAGAMLGVVGAVLSVRYRAAHVRNTAGGPDASETRAIG